jgi:hypothetical protein
MTRDDIQQNPVLSSVNASDQGVMLDTLARCYVDLKYFCKFFFPETFYSEWNPLHDKIFTVLASTEKKKKVVAAPRGLGKTSILLKGRTAHDLLFKLVRYVVYIGYSETVAVQHTENLKHALLTNELVRQLFGSIKARADEDFDAQFSTKGWATHTDIMVLPRGSGQQVRGISYHDARPDLIIFDDLEKKEALQNEEQRTKIQDWFESDPMKCVSKYDDHYTFLYIDTLKHEDSQIQRLLLDSDWEGIRLEACDDDLNPTAESYMTREEILAEYTAHKRRGTLDVFAREYRNKASAPETASFKKEFFRYFDDTGIYVHPWYTSNQEDKQLTKTRRIDTRKLLHVIIVDPAKTVKMQSADTAIVGVGFYPDEGLIFVRDVVSAKLYPDEIYEAAGLMAVRLRASTIAVEVTSLEQFVRQPFEDHLRKLRLLIRFLPLQAGADSKQKRVGALSPYYRGGYILHNPDKCKKLEEQLKAFPTSALWDVMDALSYVIKIMDDEKITLNIPTAFDENEYAGLDNEKYVEARMYI